MNEKSDNLKHDVILRSRKRIEMSGINEVSSFDEKEIIAQADNLGISIEGEKLKIERFDAEKGELTINGLINGLYYYSKEVKKKKSIVGLFK